jgi:hypothetical protein
LPNGNFAIAKYSGTVSFTSDFTITNVLYVPQFSINLIAVSKLCHSLNHLIQFSGSKCVIQDQKNLRMIGSADEYEGLYYLNLPNKIANVATIYGPRLPTIRGDHGSGSVGFGSKNPKPNNNRRQHFWPISDHGACTGSSGPGSSAYRVLRSDFIR